LLLFSAIAAHAQVSVHVRLPSASLGINIPLYPELMPVPGYPVYYAPHLHANYFFYDGLYWVYQNDNWYASSWYDGPWALVAPHVVPVFVLRIPVGYYRNPPRYFYSWRRDAPPRWGLRWGSRWERDRRGWDHWDRRAHVAPAPLPLYQREYSGRRYPQGESQRRLHDRHYHYQSHERSVVRQHPERNERSAPASAHERYERRQSPRAGPQMQRSAPQAQSAPQADERRRVQDQGRQGHRQPQMQRSAPQAQSAPQADERRRAQDQGRQGHRSRSEGRGQDRDR
jgi:hypothetical protein